MTYPLSNLVQLDDPRDHSANIVLSGTVPHSVDLMPDVTEVEDQGRVGSCTANAGCSAMELLYKRAGKIKDFSRLYLYYYERHDNGLTGDVGAQPRDICRTLAKRGVCREDIWPYDKPVDDEPTQECRDNAANFTIHEYARLDLNTSWVDRRRKVKHAVAQGIPVLLTMQVHKSFYKLKGDWKTHAWDVVGTEKNPMLGLHEVLVIGYDSQAQRFLCQNSWGKGWGDGGFFGLPFEFIDGRGIVGQLWIILSGRVPFRPVEDYKNPTWYQRVLGWIGL